MTYPVNNFTKKDDYVDQLKAISETEQGKWLMVRETDGKIVGVGLKTFIAENFKGLFGLVNHTNKELVTNRFTEILKLGEEKGWITEQEFFGSEGVLPNALRRIGVNTDEPQNRKHTHLKEIYTNIFNRVVPTRSHQQMTVDELEESEAKFKSPLLSERTANRLLKELKKADEAIDAWEESESKISKKKPQTLEEKYNEMMENPNPKIKGSKSKGSKK